MLPPTMRILVCVAPQDLRRSFDRLSGLVRELGHDPQDGTMYVFLNGRRNRLKVLWWEEHGVCLLCKRAHAALFAAPTATAHGVWTPTLVINASELRTLLAGVAKQKRPTHARKP